MVVVKKIEAKIYLPYLLTDLIHDFIAVHTTKEKIKVSESVFWSPYS